MSARSSLLLDIPYPIRLSLIRIEHICTIFTFCNNGNNNEKRKEKKKEEEHTDVDECNKNPFWLTKGVQSR